MESDSEFFQFLTMYLFKTPFPKELCGKKKSRFHNNRSGTAQKNLKTPK